MKKLFYLLMLPLALLAASCSDDNDFPDVELITSFDGATHYNDTIYAVAGDTLRLTDIQARPLQGARPAAISDVSIAVNHRVVYPTPLNPVWQGFPALVTTAPGLNLLQLSFAILQEGKSISVWNSSYIVKVVASPEDLPEGADPVGPFSFTSVIRD